MHRFFVSPDCIDGNVVTLTSEFAHQLARVLRFRAGDQITVLDDTAFEYLVTLNSVSASKVMGTITERRESTSECEVRVTLYQGSLKTDKFEFVLQKGTELGVSRFVPMICERSVRREIGRSDSRMARWRRIVKEAAEQSQRGRLPVVDEPITFHQSCDGIDEHAIIPWELETSTGLRQIVQKWNQAKEKMSALSILIGPEGGFSEDEVRYAADRGIRPLSLGKRILRAETAGIAVAAAVMYELGELGG